jgi:Reeler domain
MRQKKFTFIYSLLIGSFFLIVFSSSSGGRDGDLTGSPNSGGTCATCHNSPPGYGGDITLSNVPTSYKQDTTYTMTLTLTGIPMDGVGGFQVAALSNTNVNIGTFMPSPGTRLAGFGGLTHNSPQTESFNTATWTVKWKAPSSGNSQVKFYYVGNAADGSGGTSADDIYTGTSAFVPLPVRLVKFHVEKDKEDVQLFWATATEQNTSYFGVERADKNGKFAEIAQIATNGNHLSTQQYSFKDTEVGSENTVLYYRLKIVDRDGKTEYSSVQSVKMKGETKALIYPTYLSKNNAFLTINTLLSADNEAFIFDASGRQIQHISLEKGINTTELNLSEGLYFLKIGDKVQGITIF